MSSSHLPHIFFSFTHTHPLLLLADTLPQTHTQHTILSRWSSSAASTPLSLPAPYKEQCSDGLDQAACLPCPARTTITPTLPRSQPQPLTLSHTHAFSNTQVGRASILSHCSTPTLSLQ